MNIVFIKNFVVVYLFDFLKLSIILIITLISIVMWTFKHYSVDLDSFTIDFTASY